MSETIPAVYRRHQELIHDQITNLIAVGESSDDESKRERWTKALNMDTAKLSRLLARLSEPQRKAVTLVMLKEAGVLMFQFILECAHLLNEPARQAAALSQNDDAFDKALEAFQTLVRA